MSIPGSALRFHSCVAANSKNVKYAFLLLLRIVVEDMTESGNTNTGFFVKSLEQVGYCSFSAFWLSHENKQIQ